jgi:hypothetical protein
MNQLLKGVFIGGISIALFCSIVIYMYQDYVKKDYQIRCERNYMELWDGDRLVGITSYDNCKMDSIILADKQ